MKKLILSSVAVGIAFSVLMLVNVLLFRIVDNRLASVFFGATFVMLGTMFSAQRISCGIKDLSKQYFLSMALSVSIATLILVPFELGWLPVNTDFDASFGWALLGGILALLCVYLTSFLGGVRKRRQTYIVEVIVKSSKPNV